MKKFLHILLFITLISLKVSAAFVYIHDCHEDGHIDDCELCEYALNNQNIEFSTPPQFQGFEIDFLPTLYQNKSHYEGVYLTTPIIDLCFGRPPPSSTS